MKQEKKLTHDSRFRIHGFQTGQSLIETMGAIFVLTMALTTALGVAVYAFSKAAVSQKEIIATNLAREGVDAVRMMRDSNWLTSDTVGIGLDDDCGSGSGQDSAAEDPMNEKSCYPDWLSTDSYSMGPSENVDDYRLAESGTSLKPWVLDRRSGNEKFHLCLGLSDNPTYEHSPFCDNLTPPFARRIKISVASNSSPYTPNHPLILVQSAVIWSDKNCPPITDQNPITLDTSCKIISQEYLTNWKDYR